MGLFSHLDDMLVSQYQAIWLDPTYYLSKKYQLGVKFSPFSNNKFFYASLIKIVDDFPKVSCFRLGYFDPKGSELRQRFKIKINYTQESCAEHFD